PPIPVIVPLLVAALVAVLASKLPRRVIEVVAFATAVAATVASVVLLARTADHRIVYWFAGWRPHHGVALGIRFAIDAIGAGAAGVVVVSFALIVVGMFTKAGVVPFPFWLSDAYAVVSPPVGVVFAGVLSELGLLGVARIHWSAFEGAFTGHAGSIGHVLMAF